LLPSARLLKLAAEQAVFVAWHTRLFGVWPGSEVACLGLEVSRRDGTDQRRTLERSAMRWKQTVIMLLNSSCFALNVLRDL